VQFQDDGPAIGPIAGGQVDFSAGSSVTNSLNGQVGADDPATFTVASSPATLTILDGTSAEVTLLRDISPDQTVVTYFQDVDNSNSHTAGDIDFFKLTLSGGNYTFDVLQNPPSAEISFGLRDQFWESIPSTFGTRFGTFGDLLVWIPWSILIDYVKSL
jgi:hypothetical protein